MPPDEAKPLDQQGTPVPAEDIPPIEDAYETEDTPPEPLPEDDPELLGPSSRLLEGDVPEVAEIGEPGGAPATSPTARTFDADQADDAASIPDEPPTDARERGASEQTDWDRELSAHRVVVELKHIETEVREILADRDGRRKRKLSGSRRWRELEEDVLAWRFAGRFEEASLRRLQELIVQRDHLFRRLRFLAGTRPTWNT